MKVFLGGTVNGSTWRDQLIPQLKVDYFDPVVEEWDDKAFQLEIEEKEKCDFRLYVISPKMDGFWAMAEVVDDSFKQPDTTIFCYLKEDNGSKFTDVQVRSLEVLGKIVEGNGGNCVQSLKDVATILNGAKQVTLEIASKGETLDLFISYGRRHSKEFATHLHKRLGEEGYSSWFDQEAIPLGVDFQAVIDDGIKNSNNFVFIISPHSVKSQYCLKEIELAVELRKRIIPLMHVDASEHFELMHPTISKLNWIYFDDETQFENKLKDLFTLIKTNADYVKMHTKLLIQATKWDKNQHQASMLLKGEELKASIAWLTTEMPQDQASCQPTHLHSQWICESKKVEEGMLVDAFLSYATQNRGMKDRLERELNSHAVTLWTNTSDIRSGEDFEKAIEEGIRRSSNFLFCITPESLVSEYCMMELEYAAKLNKRIIPLHMEKVENKDLPPSLIKTQYIDFNLSRKNSSNSDRSVSEYQLSVAEILGAFAVDDDYHKMGALLVDLTFEWTSSNKPDSFLLRHQWLERAESWLKIGKKRKTELPDGGVEEYIKESKEKAPVLKSEVFLSYAEADFNFAKQLNRELNKVEKVTWFNKHFPNRQKTLNPEIQDGLQNSESVVCLISPAYLQECGQELAQAEELGKRIIIVLCPGVSLKELPEKFQNEEVVIFSGGLNTGMIDLMRKLEVDKEYVRERDKWFLKAKEWKQGGGRSEKLLSGGDLAIAANWLEHAIDSKKNPPPVQLHFEYLDASNKGVIVKKRKRRILLTFIGVLLAMSIISLIGVVVERNNAKALEEDLRKTQEKLAAKQNLFAIMSTNLADQILSLSCSPEDQAKMAELKKQLLGIKEMARETQVNLDLRNVDSLFSASGDPKLKAWAEKEAVFQPIESIIEPPRPDTVSPPKDSIPPIPPITKPEPPLIIEPKPVVIPPAKKEYLPEVNESGIMDVRKYKALLSLLPEADPLSADFTFSGLHNGAINNLLVMQNNSLVVTGGADQGLRLWKFEIAEDIHGHAPKLTWLDNVDLGGNLAGMLWDKEKSQVIVATQAGKVEVFDLRSGSGFSKGASVIRRQPGETEYESSGIISMKLLRAEGKQPAILAIASKTGISIYERGDSEDYFSLGYQKQLDRKETINEMSLATINNARLKTQYNDQVSIISASNGKTLDLWMYDYEKNELILKDSEQTSREISTLSGFRSGGSVFMAGSTDGKIQDWVNNYDRLVPLEADDHHAGPVSGLVWNPSGHQVASIGSDEKVFFTPFYKNSMDFANSLELTNPYKVSALEFVGKGYLLTAMENGDLKFWATDPAILEQRFDARKK